FAVELPHVVAAHLHTGAGIDTDDGVEERAPGSSVTVGKELGTALAIAGADGSANLPRRQLEQAALQVDFCNRLPCGRGVVIVRRDRFEAILANILIA